MVCCLPVIAGLSSLDCHRGATSAGKPVQIKRRIRQHTLYFLPLIDPKWPVLAPYVALIGSVICR